MNKKKELAKNTLIIAIGKICTQFVSFLLLPLYTTLLLPNEYGIVDLFNTYVALLVPIFNWQLETGMFRFMLDYRNDVAKQKELFSTIICSNVFQSIVYLIIFLFCQFFIKSEFKVFLAIDVVLNIFLNTLLQLPRGLGDNKTYSIGSFVSASSIVLLNVVFIVFLKMHSLGLFLATVIGKFITIIYLIIRNKTWRLFSFKCFSKDMFRNVSKYSIPLVPNQLSWWVIGVSDRTIVSSFISIAANGIYSIANKFSSIYITIYNIFNLSWTESVSIHLKDEDSKSFLSDTINSMYSLFSSICFMIIVLMPFAFPILIGKEYEAAYNQIPILMTASLFQSIVGMYSVFYVALKKSTEIAKTSLYAAIINIVVNLVLIRKIGLYGASISTLLAYASMAIFRYFHVKKYVNIPLNIKNIIISIIIYSISILAYYKNSLVLNLLSIIAVTIYSLVLNKNFIDYILKTTIKILKKIYRGEKNEKNI